MVASILGPLRAPDFDHHSLPSIQASLPPTTGAISLQELTFIEFFAGEGRVWRTVRADSRSAVGLDINYGLGDSNPEDQTRNPFDILTNAGMM